MADCFELKCKECGKTWGNVPKSFCEECFSPLEVSFDYTAIKKKVRREDIASRSFNMWRYSEFLPLPEGFTPPNAVGGTPLVAARNSPSASACAKSMSKTTPSASLRSPLKIASSPPLSPPHAASDSKPSAAPPPAISPTPSPRKPRSKASTPASSSPPISKPAKVLNTAVYGARIVRINGNYDHVNRLCAQIADRFQWGLVNVNLRPYYSEGSKTHGFEIAEQLGWRLPDNVVVPDGRRLAHRQNLQSVPRTRRTRLGRSQAREILRRASDRLLADFLRRETRPRALRTAKAQHHRPLARHRQSRRRKLRREANPAKRRLGRRRIRPEIVEAIKLLAESEGIFTETAGGVTVGVTQKLIRQGRIGATKPPFSRSPATA